MNLRPALAGQRLISKHGRPYSRTSLIWEKPPVQISVSSVSFSIVIQSILDKHLFPLLCRDCATFLFFAAIVSSFRLTASLLLARYEPELLPRGADWSSRFKHCWKRLSVGSGAGPTWRQRGDLLRSGGGRPHDAGRKHWDTTLSMITKPTNAIPEIKQK